MRTAAPMQISRRALIAIAALAALLLAAAATLHDARAQLPSDISLQLSLVEDSDNVVPPGSTIRVRASILNSGPPRDVAISEANLRMVGGVLGWETSGGGRLPIGNQQTSSGAFGMTGLVERHGYGAAAMHGKTLVISSTRVVNIGGVDQAIDEGMLHVYNRNTGTLIDTLDPPTAKDINDEHDPAAVDATEDAKAKAFGFANAVAVWEDTANDKSWIFVGSMEDTVDGITRSGRLYIYEVDLANESVELIRAIEPTKALLENDYDSETGVDFAANPDHVSAFFGSTVRISGDGNTLVVAAYNMNDIGRVFVFPKPAGSGEDWSDLEFADGSSLTAIPVPQWRDGSGNYYTWQEDANGVWYRGASVHCFPWVTAAGGPWRNPGGAATCTADQKRDYAYAHSFFGKNSVSVSYDGSRVLVLSTQKSRPNDWSTWTFEPGSQFKRYYPEAYLFLKPSGNPWTDDNTADVTFNASSFADAADEGEQFTVGHISRDRNTIAIGLPGDFGYSHTSGRVLIWNNITAFFNVPPGTVDQEPDAVLTNPDGRLGDRFGQAVSFNGYANTAANAESTKLIVGNNQYQDADAPPGASTNTAANYYGRGWVFSGTDGSWTSDTTANAMAITSPDPRRGGFFQASYAVGWDDASSSLVELIAGHQQEHHPSYPWIPSAGSGRLWFLDKDNFTPVLPVGVRQQFGELCTVTVEDGSSSSACPLYIADSSVVIPIGLTNGDSFSISGSVKVTDGDQTQTLTDVLTVTIGQVSEVQEAQLALSQRDDGSDFPSTIVVGQTTELTLKVLNENGQPSARGSIRAVIFNAAPDGVLTADIGDGDPTSDCMSAVAGRLCEIEDPLTKLTATNADKIRLTVAHPGANKTGTSRVSVTVISADGEQIRPPGVDLIFAGAATSMSIGRPATSILNEDTPDRGATGAAAVDNQDRITVTVTGRDANANAATLPTERYRWTIKDSADKVVATETTTNPRVRVDWPLRRDGPDAGTDIGAMDPLDLRDGAVQAAINVDAPATNKLATGEYTLELRVGTLTAEQTFRVIGGPNAISLERDPTSPLITLGGQVTVTATVTDADGTPVADGTRVSFSERSISEGTVFILLSPANQTTDDGVASATLLAVGTGSAYVKVDSGPITNVLPPLTVGQAARPLVARLSSTTPNSYTSYTDDAPVLASTVLPALEGVSAIQYWNANVNRWVRYGIFQGRLIPGSEDFTIERGYVLWLTNGN